MFWEYDNEGFLFIYGVGVRPSPLLLRQFIRVLYQHWMIDGDGSGAISGTNDWLGKQRNSEETCPVPLCPAQILQELSRDGIRALAVESRPLTARVTARSYGMVTGEELQ
jgi:hypothetical protein